MYANVTATLALVAAIGGGTAWATNSAHARPRPITRSKALHDHVDERRSNRAC